MSDRSEKAKAIFLEALEKYAHEQWPAFLDEACAGDPLLRAGVEKLLRAHAEIGSFHEEPRTAIRATIDQPQISERPGSLIGPYKLLQQIGEGGMGVVFMAEQSHPVQRKVALKIIKPGMDSRHVIARFEAERQALALMDHPNIAKVLDAGTSDTGRLYFVMELVKGVPITKYCDEHHLTPRERLELFVPVCQAIQHAHQKGIIHRDLKPSNVLVAQYDGKPVPRVIDFGVAKATGQKLTERTMFTQYGQIVGTLEYMSPEQAELNQLDIDTRSDIYSLGVLLYELLTGSTPFERKRLREAAFDELLRIIREEEPPKPSKRLSTTDELPSIAANRKTEPRKLSNLVRGELDWIVMKALEKDRGRRYETAYGLADDIEHYLYDEPVQACPPSASYRLRKFACRNQVAMLTAGAVAAALVLGSVVSIWQAFRATRAENLAETRLEAEERARASEAQQRRTAEAAAAAERMAKLTAEAREAETRAVLDFVENKVFAAARPEGREGGLGHDVTLRRAAEAALPFVNQSFTNQPSIEARLRMTLGTSFAFLGEAQLAAEQYQRARALYTQHLGDDHADTLASMSNLARSYRELGRHADALKLQKETLALQKATFGPDHHHTLGSMIGLANTYQELGRFDDALKFYEETLSLMNAKLGPDHSDTLVIMNNLAVCYDAIGRHTDALKLREETRAVIQATFGPDHPETLISMNNLAVSYTQLARHDSALKLNEETLALMKAKLGSGHPHTLQIMNNLAESYRLVGRHADALTLSEETLALRRAKLGPEHPSTLASMYTLANCYAAVARHADALTLREETLALRKATLGQHHPDTLESMNALAESYANLGRQAEALKLREETLELKKAKLGLDHSSTLGSMHNLAVSYRAVARYAEAINLQEQTLALMTAKIGLDHPSTLMSRNSLAWLLATCPDPKLRDSVRALELATKSVELAPQEGICWNTLGAAQYRAGDWHAAIEVLEKSIKLLAGREESFNTFLLAMAHWQLGNKAEARKWYDQAVKWMEANKPQDEDLKRFRTEAAELLQLNVRSDGAEMQ